MIKFEIYETSNSYQCHFARIGTFVVSIAHYMRAFYNYRALVDGNYFSLPDDVGYLNCIPLKLDAYWQYGERFGTNDDDDDDASDDANEDEDDEEEQEVQNILYAKVGCMARDTFTSAKFQLHVYTDNMCTNPYDDGQTSQQQASKGYAIDFNSYYTLGDDENNNGSEDNEDADDEDQESNILQFSTNVSFRPTFYQCQNCKPDAISETFNKFSGSWYDDEYINQYGERQQADDAAYAEEEEEEAAACTNCQYYHYSADDAIDAYNSENGDGSDVDDAYVASDDGTSSSSSSSSAAAVDDAYYNAVDDAYMYNTNDDGGRRLGEHISSSAVAVAPLPPTSSQSQSQSQQIVLINQDDHHLIPAQKEFMVSAVLLLLLRLRVVFCYDLCYMLLLLFHWRDHKFLVTISMSTHTRILFLLSCLCIYFVALFIRSFTRYNKQKFELEFWKDVKRQREHRDRKLYDNQYGGVDDWNMCEQVYKYGLYCDEQCIALDAFTHTQWSSADIALLSIMVTFMAAMMILVVAKRLKASRAHRRQRSFFINNNYDPSTTSITAENMPGIPPLAMFIIFTFVMITIIALSMLNFVNETLVFAVVCCILLFIYMLKLTLFHSTRKQPVLLASPNHEDVFKYNDASVSSKDVFFT
jgi:hypothetical protein